MPDLHCCNQDQNFSANLNNHYTRDYKAIGATEKNQFMTEELFQRRSSAVADRETKIPCTSKMKEIKYL